ncbi:F0F1 ATP synthase subunit delta [Halalkalibacter sp. APA_J-10(15)]|uniref:F0F1 ATP synthase subunit delta n=1 Tax=unclassified Halalkalibacter TaxID=2893063 RepID=UPI001FF310BB|nr:F0F1 ATP synthase subunit delta [Halalkalibacter sp. APA_J-10(15)]MCK0470047.1 F0F1 ATP synthase subunit delta [Halalkalibacter sp. APA_J-10(15)]
MSNLTVANRYAEALFKVAQEKNVLNELNAELQLVKVVIESTPEFVQFVSHPKVKTEKKQAFIKESFGQALSEPSLHLIYLLVDRKRTDILVPLIQTFKKLALEAQDKAEALVYSAKPLAKEDEQQIAELFAKKAGKKQLEVKNVVDQELIGGLKIRIGDRIYDGSVKAQLDRMQRQLIAGTR